MANDEAVKVGAFQISPLPPKIPISLKRLE
jgi:hypothetical protein